MSAIYQQPRPANSWKPACRVVRQVGGRLDGLAPVDGVALEDDMRVFLVAQALPEKNGPWVASAGLWVRPDDFDDDIELVPGIIFRVTSGLLGAGSWWQLSDPLALPIVLGVTPLVFTRILAF
jgi:hypothetical protein